MDMLLVYAEGERAASRLDEYRMVNSTSLEKASADRLGAAACLLHDEGHPTEVFVGI